MILNGCCTTSPPAAAQGQRTRRSPVASALHPKIGQAVPENLAARERIRGDWYRPAEPVASLFGLSCRDDH